MTPELWRAANLDEAETAHLCCDSYCSADWPDDCPAKRLVRVPFDEAKKRALAAYYRTSHHRADDMIDAVLRAALGEGT